VGSFYEKKNAPEWGCVLPEKYEIFSTKKKQAIVREFSCEISQDPG